MISPVLFDTIKSVIQTMKYSFVNERIVYQSFYGALLTLSNFFSQEKFCVSARVGLRRRVVCKVFIVLGPLHMSAVTALAGLPGRILLSVHMGNYSTVDREEIQETKPKW